MSRVKRSGCIPLLAVLCAVLQACAITNHIARPVEPDPGARIVVLADVEISVMTAGGMLEPRADWTESGRMFLLQSLDALLGRKSQTLVRYQDSSEPDVAYADAQILKLHDVVGTTIFKHRMGAPVELLPTVKDRFDWSLGPGVRALGERHGAQYALIVFVRDGHESAGRIFAGIAAAAIAGVVLAPPRKEGFASLVDLSTGDLLWFNHVDFQPSGDDLRTEPGAGDIAESLLDGYPL